MTAPTQPLIWSPPDVSSTRIDSFRAEVAKKYSVDLPDYFAFWDWSVNNVGPFWEEIWDECGIIGDKGSRGAGVASGHDLYPPPLWFPGSSVNFAENMLRNCRDPQVKGKTAVVSAYEPDKTNSSSDELDFSAASLTHEQLYGQVAHAAHSFRSFGVKQGDIISAYSANNLPSLVAFLACSSLGAIWCSVSADAAPEAVLDRFETVRPKWIVSVENVRYNGKKHEHIAKLKEVLSRLRKSRSGEEQAVEGVIVAPGPSGKSELDWEALAKEQGEEQWLSWSSFLEQGSRDASSSSSSPEIPFVRLDFNDPLWILFSSGTTGKPKAIVHRAGGMLLQLAKEHILHSGLTSDDVLFQFTTLSWMMSPWSVSSLIAGSTLVLYDGSPLQPDPLVLWHLAAKYGITVFGTSAAYLEILMRKEVQPKEKYGSSLKVKQILSTGSALRAEVYVWIKKVLGSILVGSITGGTDLCSLLAGNNVALPVYAGEIQGPNLGMHLGIMSTVTGKPIPFPPLRTASSMANGSVDDAEQESEGDLVVLSPFPAQPLRFHNQSESKYRSSYYELYGPSVWAHGDWSSWTDRGGVVMKGRSDGVLNPGGVRFGSGEIYEVVTALINSASSSDSGSSSGAATLKDVSQETLALLQSVNGSIALGLNKPTTNSEEEEFSPSNTSRTSDEIVVLFLSFSTPAKPSEESSEWNDVISLLKDALRTQRSPRHVPSFIVPLSSTVPLTVNGKLAEVPAKRVLNGQAKRTTLASEVQAPQWKGVNTSTLEDSGRCLLEFESLGAQLRDRIRQQQKQQQ